MSVVYPAEHMRLGRKVALKVLAREGDTDHAALHNWWRFWHPRIGKAGT
jgi:hypothetical protein